MAMKISGFIKGNFHTRNHSDQIQNVSFDSNSDGISKKIILFATLKVVLCAILIYRKIMSYDT